MAGHSKYKNIMYRKGAQDKEALGHVFETQPRDHRRGEMGLPDPDMNPRLRAAVNAAKAQSMPKDNIQRSIDKATKGDAENYEEIRYEAFAPGGASLIIETLTDNRNRTVTNVRTAISKNGGNLGAPGSVAHAFDRKGLISYPAKRWRRGGGVRGSAGGWRGGRAIVRGRPRNLDRDGGPAPKSPRLWKRRSARPKARSWRWRPQTMVDVGEDDAATSVQADRTCSTTTTTFRRCGAITKFRTR